MEYYRYLIRIRWLDAMELANLRLKRPLSQILLLTTAH